MLHYNNYKIAFYTGQKATRFLSHIFGPERISIPDKAEIDFVIDTSGLTDEEVKEKQEEVKSWCNDHQVSMKYYLDEEEKQLIVNIDISNSRYRETKIIFYN